MKTEDVQFGSWLYMIWPSAWPKLWRLTFVLLIPITGPLFVAAWTTLLLAALVFVLVHVTFRALCYLWTGGEMEMIQQADPDFLRKHPR